MSTMTARQFVSMYDCKSLRCVSAGGEKLDPVAPLSQLRFLNVYGSSECCGMVTCHTVKGDEDNVPIGKAPGTYRLYIVGEEGQPVADGEAGELWVSGFYEEDCAALIASAQAHGLQLLGKKENNTWYMLKFIKS